jgi:HSP20 family protein
MLTGWTPFDDTLRALDLLQHRVDRAFDGRGYEPAWPAINLFETKESFVVKAEVPGLGESDVSLFFEDDSLVLRGERKAEVPEGYEVRLRERAPFAFTRKLPLPARVDVDAVAATLKDGVLTVTLPKAKDALPRQIAVKAG